MTLELRPTSLRKANDFVDEWHRHNGRTVRNGGKFAVSCWWTDETIGEIQVGVAIVGNPLSATFMDGLTAEVLRVCTADFSPKNVCSMLYSSCWRAWKAMGGRRLVTYTLRDHETGVSLRAAGWKVYGETKPVAPGWRKNDHLTREHQAVMLEPKNRWEMRA